MSGASVCRLNHWIKYSCIHIKFSCGALLYCSGSNVNEPFPGLSGVILLSWPRTMLCSFVSWADFVSISCSVAFLELLTPSPHEYLLFVCVTCCLLCTKPHPWSSHLRNPPRELHILQTNTSISLLSSFLHQTMWIPSITLKASWKEIGITNSEHIQSSPLKHESSATGEAWGCSDSRIPNHCRCELSAWVQRKGGSYREWGNLYNPNNKRDK